MASFCSKLNDHVNKICIGHIGIGKSPEIFDFFKILKAFVQIPSSKKVVKYLKLETIP